MYIYMHMSTDINKLMDGLIIYLINIFVHGFVFKTYTPLSTFYVFIIVPCTIWSYIIPTSIFAIQLKSMLPNVFSLEWYFSVCIDCIISTHIEISLQKGWHNYCSLPLHFTIQIQISYGNPVCHLSMCRSCSLHCNSLLVLLAILPQCIEC